MTYEEKKQLANALAVQAVEGIFAVCDATQRTEGRHVLDLLIAELNAVVERDDQMTRDSENYKPSPPALEGEDA